MSEPTEKTVAYSCLCPADGTTKEVRLIYTADSRGIYWKNHAVTSWCTEEAVCPESMGNPPRCPIFLAAPRILTQDMQ